jgi:hypothetical protein
MKKFNIIILAVLLLGVVSSVSAYRFATTYNPYTNKQDYYATANFSGEDLVADTISASIDYSYVVGAPWITDGNSGWDNSYAFFNNITNFTGTLTDNKICTYSSSTQRISCAYTDQVGEAGTTDGNNYTTSIAFKVSGGILNLTLGRDGMSNLEALQNLSNTLTLACQNITGATSNLCTLVDTDTNDTTAINLLVSRVDSINGTLIIQIARVDSINSTVQTHTTNINNLIVGNTTSQDRISNLNTTKLNVADGITFFVNRTDWTTHDNYPTACSAGTFVTAIGDTLTCQSAAGGSGMTSFNISNRTNTIAIGNNSVFNITGGTGIRVQLLGTEFTIINTLIDTNDTTNVNLILGNTSKWESAYGWGDHSLEGYLTSYNQWGRNSTDIINESGDLAFNWTTLLNKFLTGSGFDGANITSGTVADARIASTITRDTEVPSLETDSITTPKILYLNATKGGLGSVECGGTDKLYNITLTNTSLTGLCTTDQTGAAVGDGTGGWTNTSTYTQTTLNVNITGTLNAPIGAGNITSGTIDDARISSAITRDSEVPSLETDAAHDTCAEITGCVTGAITDGNTGWNDEYGYAIADNSAYTNITILQGKPDNTAGWSNTTIYTTTNLIVNITGNANFTKNVTINQNLFVFNTTFNGTDGNIYYNGGLRIQFNSTCTTLFSPNGLARSEVCN